MRKMQIAKRHLFGAIVMFVCALPQPGYGADCKAEMDKVADEVRRSRKALQSASSTGETCKAAVLWDQTLNHSMKVFQRCLTGHSRNQFVADAQKALKNNRELIGLCRRADATE